MPILLFLSLAAAVIVATALKSGSKLSALQTKYAPASSKASKAISALVIVAQLNELVKVVEHANFVTFAGAIMLLMVLVASKNGNVDHRL